MDIAKIPDVLTIKVDEENSKIKDEIKQVTQGAVTRI